MRFSLSCPTLIEPLIYLNFVLDFVSFSCLDKLFKTEKEKYDLITDLNETGNAQQQLDEVKRSKDALESRVSELEEVLSCKDQQLCSASEKLQSFAGKYKLVSFLSEMPLT